MMQPATQSYPAVSVFYLSVPVSGGTALGTQVIELAFIPNAGAPTVSTTWLSATWTGTDVTTTLPDGSTVHTRPCSILLGQAPAALTPGLYMVYARVHADPELPAVPSGLIKIV